MRGCHCGVVRGRKTEIVGSFPYASPLFSPINCMSTKRRRQSGQLCFEAIDVVIGGIARKESNCMTKPVLETNLQGIPCRRGKVRDVYDLGDRLVIVATDRISAFDWVLPTPIPDKGRVLTALTLFWLDYLQVPNHLLGTDAAALGGVFADHADMLRGRTCIVRKATVVPVECVVRGYLAGSGWKEYREHGAVCGVALPAGLQQSSALPEPIFTPATKEESGHDENITFEQMSIITTPTLAAELRDRCIDIYRRAAAYASGRGILLADTKFEWGHLPTGELILIDEVLTPDSSRFWPADAYRVGSSPPSYDKQFVRDWLESTGWDKNSAPPTLLPEVVERTREKYLEAYEKLTGSKLP
jgi:phosphoribosylaminoimidazole-succinocarboxamide synthase